jgi:hypothetical protein
MLVKAWKDIIKKFESARKKTNGSLESKLFAVLKVVGVELARYHGGSLIGKDVKRVMQHVDYIFDEFATILKNNKKSDCEMSDEDIDQMCQRYSNLLLLWDGAFSYARKIDPSQQDIEQYQQFVTAAVNCHQAVGCTITLKVHLMLAHVAWLLGLIPGGLWDKAEDWLERQHQVQSSLRGRFAAVAAYEQKANCMQFASHEETHPALRRKRANVTANTSRKSTKPQEKRAEFQRQQVRNRMRCHALLCWKEGAVIRGKKEDYHECSSTVDDGKDCKEDIIVRDGL